jgi:hypothetical protein
VKILLAHADGDEEIADGLAQPLIDAGYDVVYRGTVLVGDSMVEQASQVIASGGPVIICGSVKGVGTGWAHRVANAARTHPNSRIYALQVDKDAYLQQLALDATVARYWQNPVKAINDLIVALGKHYPDATAHSPAANASILEARYRQLALESCDIIDLANLPDIDRHLATRQLDLRSLYVALRVHTQTPVGPDDHENGPEPAQGFRPPTSPFRRGENDRSSEVAHPTSIGERLENARRLVVLGDPGAGKTTVVRWIATAYLLKLQDDPDWAQLPDVATLPDHDWLPFIVRCRDLSANTLSGSLDDVLLETLLKAAMGRDEAERMRDLIRQRLVTGSALLLLDGLDEITDPQVRAGFCRQLETVHIAYPEAPIIATSRIVGYREMGYRLERGFEHVTMADLSPNDKDDFARRWCRVTEIKERRIPAAEELIRDIHSTDRIEKLTGNPMLLTTMALVKRKVGKLPSRRADLYWDAVEVLLNWRREVDAPLDHHEAVPQLEYIAYSMCDRGTQRLREDEILELLASMRAEYPQVHAVKARSPSEFLSVVERRTGILVETGRVRHQGRQVGVFEFRHLTFQEYLAGLAIVDGRYPGRDRQLALSAHVADLAGATAKVASVDDEEELAVSDQWREALRICAACCSDDDVDDVVLAILDPAGDEDPVATGRPRALLAAQCLADETNVSEAVAVRVLEALVLSATMKDGFGRMTTLMDKAVDEVSGSRWADLLCSVLARDFVERTSLRPAVGGLCASAMMPEIHAAERYTGEALVSSLSSTDGVEAAKTCLGLVQLGWRASQDDDSALRALSELGVQVRDSVVEALFRDEAVAYAAAWALFWLVRQVGDDLTMTLTKKQRQRILRLMRNERYEPMWRFLLHVLASVGEHSVELLVDEYSETVEGADMWTVVGALELLASPEAARRLTKMAESADLTTDRLHAIRALAQVAPDAAKVVRMNALKSEDPVVRAGAMEEEVNSRTGADLVMLSRDLDGMLPFLQPETVIDVARVKDAARAADVSEGEARRRYQRLAGELPLRITWRVTTEKAGSSARQRGSA